ncbi:MAG: peroxiredoxin [Acidimicrobiales bacterium]|nr:peroxiredoxin [Acidimicrobiales bacterium]
MISVGDPAPDFAIPGTDGRPDGRRTFTLAEFRGLPVVLVFYPADHSAVCTLQLTTYTNDMAQFDDVGAQVLGLSPQSLDVHDEFIAEHGLGFPLLADEDKAVGAAYGVLGPMGFYKRSVFVVDAVGVVRYVHRATAGLTFRATEEIVEAVRSLEHA